MSQKHAITTFLSRKFTITRSLIALEDFLDSSITPHPADPYVLPDVFRLCHLLRHFHEVHEGKVHEGEGKVKAYSGYRM